jgi:hypothetical protein
MLKDWVVRVDRDELPGTCEGCGPAILSKQLLPANHQVR